MVLRHRYLIVVCFFVGTLIALLVSKLSTPVYEATAQFISDASASNSTVLPGAEIGVTPIANPTVYYSDVVKSSEVIGHVLDRKIQGDKKIIDLLELPTTDAATTPVLARKILRGVVALATSASGSAVLNLKVQWSDAQLAPEIANAFLEELISYDRRLKSARARQRREFIEKQSSDTEKSLKEAEDRLRDFRRQNRLVYTVQSVSTGASSALNRSSVFPELQLEDERRDREVRLQSDLYVTLRKELELAKIAENNDASSLAVVERASSSTARQSNYAGHTGIMVLGGAAVGLMLGVFAAFVLECAVKMDTRSEEGREFLEHISSLRSDLRKLIGISSRSLIHTGSDSKEDGKNPT